jgi:hypothetical protein
MEVTMNRVALALSCFLALCSDAFPQTSAESEGPVTIQEKTAGMEEFPGYFTFYWDGK